MKEFPIDWLLASNPWTKHMTQKVLLGLPDSSEEVLQSRKELENHPNIRKLMDDATNWFDIPTKRHDDAKMSHYQLKMLADFGFTESNPTIRAIMEYVMQHVEDDTFAIKQALPERGNSTKIGKDFNEWHALPCDSPIISSTLYRLGNRSDLLMKSIEKIKQKWLTETGWFCHLFFVSSQFKKHQRGCMMAGLQALELFSLFPENVDKKMIQNAYQPIRYHKEYGQSLYYFGRSKKFWSFKYPYVWYNALYIADVLSRFDMFKDEVVLKEIIDWIETSQDEQGCFQPTSMFMYYKNWDFSNKKEKSPWVTYLCCKILKQYYS